VVLPSGGRFQPFLLGIAQQVAGLSVLFVGVVDATFQPPWAQRVCDWQNSALLKQLMGSGKWHSTYTR
jgi:hypothetical protein